MTRVRGDRYVAGDGGRAWDLATGDEVPLDAIGDDEEPCSEQDLAALVELLEQGREGAPRWVVADARSGAQAAGMTRRAAAAARRRGFVAISVDLYHRLHDVVEEDLRDRALLLIGGFGDAAAACDALTAAAAFSPRPHVLLTFRSVAVGGTAVVVREARSAYGNARPALLDPRPAPDGSRRRWFDPHRAAPLPADVAQQVRRAEQAVAFARIGRHAAAERLLRDVRAALERRGARGPAAQVALTLGRLLLERGRAKEAEAIFGDAACLADTVASGGRCDGHAAEGSDGHAGGHASVARAWQAWARTDLRRLTEAESLLRAVLITGAGCGGRAWAHTALARCLLWQGRVEEAIPAASLAGGDPDGLDPSMAAARHDVVVRVLLATGRLFEAGQRARECLDAATASVDPLARAIAQVAHLRVTCAAGDLATARTELDVALRLARDARAPHRAARARLIWLEAAQRAGAAGDAHAARAPLRRVARVAPPILRDAIETAVERDASAAPVSGAATWNAGVGGAVDRMMGLGPDVSAAALVRVAYDEDDDQVAVQRALERVGGALRTSRIDLVSCDAGPVTALLAIGSGLATSLGPRILDSGMAIGFDARQACREAGTPVRLGSRLLAAIVCRWPLDRDAPPHAKDLVDLAAAVLAPRVDSLLSRARETARASVSIPELVGVSSAMAEVRKAIARAASAPFAVLIEGESGTGKELVARAIHHLGPRRERRFCDVNCAALPDELLESELFGHARGAFTGAVADRAGLFEEAHGGTLFLDEVADLSPRAQAKLLRVVQQQEVRRVGETFSRAVDVRLVAAANRDMQVEAAAGRFRQDLLYRLDVIRLRLPPLRERPDDVSVLAEHFWRDAAGRMGSAAVLPPAVLADLARYHWPGNVRELQNVMAALAVAAPSRGRVRPALLPAVIGGAAAVSAVRLAEARDQFERRFVEAALARAAGSRARAAAALGVSRQGLLKMLARLGIQAGGDGQ